MEGRGKEIQLMLPLSQNASLEQLLERLHKCLTLFLPIEMKHLTITVALKRYPSDLHISSSSFLPDRSGVQHLSFPLGLFVSTLLMFTHLGSEFEYHLDYLFLLMINRPSYS
jgi:hypothetical protein